MINEMKFNEDVAMMCGLKEAVLASFLWDLVAKDDDVMYRYGRLWSRNHLYTVQRRSNRRKMYSR